uniref:C-type lectin domain-containing protein n=1 Tax=Erpetoichthys calabaricus TaxID=27687 RepID=A0A8C4T2I2_ERPCA
FLVIVTTVFREKVEDKLQQQNLATAKEDLKLLEINVTQMLERLSNQVFALHQHLTDPQLENTDLQNRKTYPYCSESWVLFNASCYFFSTDKLDWNASRNNCTSIGGHLVIIDSEEDYSSSWDKSYWIGLTDQKTEGHFLWMNNKHLDENKM